MSRTIYELLKEKPEITGEEIRNSMDFALEQVTENLARFTHSFKRAFREDNFYSPT